MPVYRGLCCSVVYVGLCDNKTDIFLKCLVYKLNDVQTWLPKKLGCLIKEKIKPCCNNLQPNCSLAFFKGSWEKLTPLKKNVWQSKFHLFFWQLWPFEELLHLHSIKILWLVTRLPIRLSNVGLVFEHFTAFHVLFPVHSPRFTKCATCELWQEARWTARRWLCEVFLDWTMLVVWFSPWTWLVRQLWGHLVVR